MFLNYLQDHPKAVEGAMVEVESLEGTPILVSFSRSTKTGWGVAFGIPVSSLTIPLLHTMWLSMGGAAAFAVVGPVLAQAISRRITRSLKALVGPALAIGSPAAVPIQPSEIAEVNEVARSLANAARLLDERLAERQKAELAERRMAVAKEAAEEANRAKMSFLSLMSHELRTPMNGILGFSQLLSDDHFGPLTGKQREFVNDILFSGNHLLALINDVLEFSKIESGRLTVSLESVDLVPLVRSIAANLEQSAAKAGIALHYRAFDLSQSAVLADRVRLAQCLLNLGTNAIKYNRPQGSVTLSCEQLRGKKIRISVSDTGFGIPKERWDELFRPFSRLGAEQLAIDGTGMGLALTRRLVELMGSEIGFDSEVGKGSCFWIDVPLYSAVAIEDREVLEVDTLAMPRSGFSVLYVEDNPSNLTLVRNILETLENVSLIEAVTAATGIALAMQHRPDLIILDINLPDLNGFALLKRLQHIPELAGTPVLALSASATPMELKRGVAAGFFRYLTKPLDVNEFIASIMAALVGRHSTVSSLSEDDQRRSAVLPMTSFQKRER